MLVQVFPRERFFGQKKICICLFFLQNYEKKIQCVIFHYDWKVDGQKRSFSIVVSISSALLAMIDWLNIYMPGVNLLTQLLKIS